MTGAAVLCFLFLLTLCGWGSAMLLMPRDASGHRVLMVPILGLCCGVLVTNFLAIFGLTGRSIGILALLFFTLLPVCLLALSRVARRRESDTAALGWKAARIIVPLAGEEFRRAALPLVTGLVCLLLVAWPLLVKGCGDYWGLANTDQPFYLTIADYIQSHPFGLPSADFAPGAQGLDTGVIVGVFYLFSMVSLISGIPVSLLFNVACAALLFLIPVSTVLLAEVGFGLRRRVSLTAGLLAASSSLIAHTFYLDSLGALSVMVLAPAALALAIRYLQRPDLKQALVVALFAASMYYCYFPGFGVMAVLIGAVVMGALVQRTVSIRHALLLASLAAVITACVFAPQAIIIFRRLVGEVFSRRLAATGVADEIILSFATTVTEQFVPFFWGLKPQGIAPYPRVLGSAALAPLLLYGLGLLLFAVLAFSVWRRVSALPADYTWALGGFLAVIGIYFAKDNGYGVFKLTTWVQPLVITGFAASFMGMAQVLKRSGFPKLAAAMLVIPVIYAGANVSRGFKLATFTLNKPAPGTISSAPDLDLEAYRELRNAARACPAGGIAVALGDSVAQRWSTPYLRDAGAYFLPTLTLNVTDSDFRDAAQRWRDGLRDVQTGCLLHWVNPSFDISPVPRLPDVWRTRVFGLAPIRSCRDVLLLGAGWYRKEQVWGVERGWQKRFRWLRKRGEAVLLDPSPGPKQLRLALAAGYGNPSATRHLILYVNGRKLDEIKFSAYARLVSSPFTPDPVWNHIELEIQEDAQALPRPYALWKKWIPLDPRILNVAVSEIAVVSAENADTDATPAVDLRVSAQFNRAMMNGVYPDLWIGREAEFKLRLPSNADQLEISGVLPNVKTFASPYRIHASLDGMELAEQKVNQPGPFDLRFSLCMPGKKTSADGVATVVIRPESTFVPSRQSASEDSRPLSIMVERLAALTGSACRPDGGVAHSLQR